MRPPTLLLACSLLALAAAAQAPATPPQLAPPSLLLGTAWYPEQWPESRWPADLDLMQKAHVNFVRVGEFAWADMEPTEGVYRFEWLDHAIAEAAKRGIRTVLGTPTATPPAWLTQHYPETLRIDESGHQLEHGNRQQFNWDNPKYRELARGIATALATRYGHNPNVLGWQIDNEYAKESYDPATRADFQRWLRTHYGTLDNLNARWTTSYWSQRYTDWNQIPIQTTYGNPGLLLSWQRFVSDTWRSYQRNQLDAIRAVADPHQFITTNMLGWAMPFDHYTVSADLDFASWDDYIPQGHLDPVRNGATDDLTRGFKRKNFWIMETQPGAVNWGAINTSLDKGEVRALAWHDVGHGADAIGYWQWRSALSGQEQYHGTLVGANGTPAPVYEEIAQLGQEFAAAAPILRGTSPHSQVAILHNYSSFWSINWQKHNRDYDPIQALLSYYGPLRQQSQSVDIVEPTADLSQYKLVVAPALNVLTPAEAQALRAYVEHGGHLVLGQRSAMKDEDNALNPQQQPGPLAELLGAHVDQFYALEAPVPVAGQAGSQLGMQLGSQPGSQTSRLWAEKLVTTAPDAEVLARFGPSNGWLDGAPAIVTRRRGAGRITYVGVWMEPAGMERLSAWLLSDSQVTAALGPVPEGVEVNARYGNGHTVFILVNLAPADRTVTLPQPMTNILPDTSANSLGPGKKIASITLKRFGVAVLEK